MTATVVGCSASRCAAIDFAGEGAVANDDSPPVAGDGLPSSGAAAEKKEFHQLLYCTLPARPANVKMIQCTNEKRKNGTML